MGYRSLRQCVNDLKRTRQLVCIDEEIDPYLEAAEIQRRVYAAGGPAVYYARVRHCRFPMVSNLFGTMDRARYLFRDALHAVRDLIALKTSPDLPARRPWKIPSLARTLTTLRPAIRRSGPVLECRTTIDALPQMVSWPKDAGAFITLPQVYTEHPDHPGYRHSNLGMYRVQLSGNQYRSGEQVGLHYQIHRSIAAHHAAALNRSERLPVHVFVGGPPAMMLAAVMPLPDGIPELSFAGALARRSIRMIRRSDGPLLSADADFCICGTLDDEQLPEGPFGDHLGYYSLTHDFPVLNVERVYHRRDAIWPFTVVGRPPQEDTVFGELIHELTGPAIPSVLPGVREVHAVDASGVHPLLLAIGSERYVPWAAERRPQELLTIASAILGQGQLSLAKYLLLAATEDDPQLRVHDIPAFFRHILSRVDFTRDLHFHTKTTIDTLDYTGTGLNSGSKLVIAAAGPERRSLNSQPPDTLPLPDGFGRFQVCLPGILAVTAPKWSVGPHGKDPWPERFCSALQGHTALDGFPLVVLVDDAAFCAASLDNFLWVTFTRSNPAADVLGIDSFTEDRHWGCRGSLVIDARMKAHMAPPLEPDPDVVARVDRLFRRSGPLHGIERRRPES